MQRSTRSTICSSLTAWHDRASYEQRHAATFAASSTRNGRWRLRLRAATTCCWSARRARARACWRSRLPGILPSNDAIAEALETAAIDSVLGMPVAVEAWRQRPFRASAPHRVGRRAGRWRAGAHGPARFRGRTTVCCSWMSCRSSIAGRWRSCANPLETGTHQYCACGGTSGVSGKIPADRCDEPVSLCGFLAMTVSPTAAAVATGSRPIGRKISGPLLDRIDLHVEVLRPPTRES